MMILAAVVVLFVAINRKATARTAGEAAGEAAGGSATNPTTTAGGPTTATTGLPRPPIHIEVLTWISQ